MTNTKLQQPTTTLPKRPVLSAWCRPVALTAYERVKFARSAPANDNGRVVVRNEVRRGR